MVNRVYYTMNKQTQQEDESEAYDWPCEHEYEHVDHLETVADEYRRELYCCIFCNREKVVTRYFGVRD